VTFAFPEAGGTSATGHQRVEEKGASGKSRTALSVVERSPVLAELVEAATEDELRFANGTGVAAFPCSSRGGRGWPIFALLMDEAARFVTETEGPQVAERVFGSLVPSTAQFGDLARIVVSSTPWGQDGFFAETFQRASSGELADAVAFRGTTAELNPSINPALLARERERDPDGFRSEYLAQFVGGGVVTDQYLAPAVVDFLRRRGPDVWATPMTAASKTAAFGELRARLYGGTLELYEEPTLLAELRRLRAAAWARTGYSETVPPAFPPTLLIHPLRISNSTVSPFESLTVAKSPLNQMSCTVASANDLCAFNGIGVQFLIFIPPTRSQTIRSQAGWVMYRLQLRPAAKSRAQLLTVRTISSPGVTLGAVTTSCSVERLAVVGAAGVAEPPDRRASAAASAARTPMAATISEVRSTFRRT
jgi:hypothetical protein